MFAKRYLKQWKRVETQSDIEELLDTCGGFHDACIQSVAYGSGMRVNTQGAMFFGELDDYRLTMTFGSQWAPRMIQLRFVGVRRLHLIGIQDNYSGDIYDAYLAFHEDLLPSRYRLPAKVIVWADAEDFDPHGIGSASEEPGVTYVMAHALEWRIVKTGKSNLFYSEKRRR